MTFSPDFDFYRDGRPVDAPVPDDFWAAMRREAADELAYRTDHYPAMVKKARMKPAVATHELRVWRAIAEDWGAAPRSPGFPIATWTEMVHSLRREIALRRKFYPARVAERRLDAVAAERKLLLVETWHDLLWHARCAEARAARAATAAAAARAALATAA